MDIKVILELNFILAQPPVPPQPVRPPMQPTGIVAPPTRMPQPPVSQAPANASPGLVNAGASDQEKVIIYIPSKYFIHDFVF